MEEKFVIPEMEVIRFDSEDIIRTSGCDICDGYICDNDGDSCCQPKWIG